MKLFFIPYAGGSVNSYRVLRKYIDNEIDMVYLELAGRGARIKEAFYKDINEAAEDVFQQIKAELNKGESYAIFGHSMGALITYEAVQKLEMKGIHYPKHIFISARKAPHLKDPNRKVYMLPDDEFIEELSKIGDLNMGFVKEPKLFKNFLPIIRSDYKMIEEYIFQEPIKKYKCNISIIYALDDSEAPKEEVLEWKKYKGKDLECYEFNGGHFYLFSNREILPNILNNTLYQYMNN
ncbi:thioesterase [Clostridium botulinum]|nr:thioesterase [Clostridium botulinum]